MKRILVMRHAKSSWQDSQLADYDRPLNRRGQRDGPRMARALSAASECPDVIISSSAKRARLTAELLVAAAGFRCPVEFTERFYGASVGQYVQRLRELPPTCGCALVIGHNPTLEQLVWALTGQAVTLPTAAVARITVPILQWDELDRLTRGELIDVLRPRELADGD
jgi:phosphohistidine phosphatase